MQHQFASLPYLKSQWPEFAPFYTQSWVYAGISSYFSQQNIFDQLVFDDVSDTFVIQDYNTKLDFQHKYHGCVYEGHPCYWINLEKLQPGSVLISGHDHFYDAGNYVSLGFDYWDITTYNEFSKPIFFYELNRSSVQNAVYDVMIITGNKRPHRITFLRMLSEHRDKLTIVTDDSQTVLDTDLRFSTLGLEVYLNKLGAQNYKQYTFYPSFWDTNNNHTCLNFLPHKKMYSIARVHLVLETTAYTTDFPYCNEKTFKALAQHSAFVVYGDTGILRKLKNQGFMTFGDYCDESYDLETDTDKRMLLVIEAAKQLTESCKKYPEAIDRICEHNQNLFFDPQRHANNLAKFGKRFMSIISGA